VRVIPIIYKSELQENITLIAIGITMKDINFLRSRIKVVKISKKERSSKCIWDDLFCL